MKPAWTSYVKTGAHAERAPEREDWFFVRMGSLLYRVYKELPLGVGSLRTYYGGKKNRGVKKEKFRKASGKVIRTALQELEKLGFVKKEKTGRIITPKGQSYLNRKAKQVAEKFKQQLKEKQSLQEKVEEFKKKQEAEKPKEFKPQTPAEKPKQIKKEGKPEEIKTKQEKPKEIKHLTKEEKKTEAKKPEKAEAGMHKGKEKKI